jgi:hypothetical protein
MYYFFRLIRLPCLQGKGVDMKNLWNLAVLLGLMTTSSAFAHEGVANPLFGKWELTKFLVISADGQAVEFCEGAYGNLIYDAKGGMSVGINCGSVVPKEAPAYEYGGMLFYSGTFKIKGNAVVHLISNSTTASLIGKTVTREVESLTKNSLVLVGKLGVKSLRIEWKKNNGRTSL